MTSAKSKTYQVRQEHLQSPIKIKKNEKMKNIKRLERGPMPNVMAALPNIGGALCSTTKSLTDAHYWSAVQ